MQHMSLRTAATAGLALALTFCTDGSSNGPNTTLEAAFTPSCTGLVCTFADSSTDADGTIVSWNWDFGDGFTSTDPQPAHTYSQAGTYSVRLTVRDNLGTTSAASQDLTLAESDVVFIGAGDIAGCAAENKDEATAALISALPDAQVFTLGDNAYPDGTTADYGCFDFSWGAFKDRTHPAPGNHEYHQPGAAPYFAYFGASAGPAGAGYYSYDLGTWHIVALNSEIGVPEQAAWLQADLAAHPAECVLAYWHRPFFTSGAVHPPESSMRPFYDALQAAGAEIVLSGHNHQYERFAPQLPDGTASSEGIRQFVVGTGGFHGLYDFIPTAKPNSEARYKGFGVLKLTLGANGYSWEFMSIVGASFADSGMGKCH